MSIWFRKYRSTVSPRVRLFCFPYAGGNAAVFDGWHRQLPRDVDVFAVQAPGRANRFGEPPIANLAEKVQELRVAIAPYMDAPSVFIGHSNGALTAFELARSLQHFGYRNLCYLIISAKRAPHLPRNSPILHNLPERELIEELRKLAATPSAILDDLSIMDVFLPMLRADFALAENGDILNTPLLRVPCALFYGEHDDVSRDDILAWDKYIDGPLSVRKFEGGHFFIDTQRAAVIAAVGEILDSCSVDSCSGESMEKRRERPSVC